MHNLRDIDFTVYWVRDFGCCRWEMCSA